MNCHSIIFSASGVSCDTAKSSTSTSATRSRNLPRHSRSFKTSCPPPRRETARRSRRNSLATSDVGPSLNASQNSRLGCPTMTSERIDSTYGTDSNRTVSPQNAKSEPGQFFAAAVSSGAKTHFWSCLSFLMSPWKRSLTRNWVQTKIFQGKVSIPMRDKI